MEDLGESNSRANENSPDLERNVGEDEIILDDDEDGDDDISYGVTIVHFSFLIFSIIIHFTGGQ